jgi:hypothetical protein
VRRLRGRATVQLTFVPAATAAAPLATLLFRLSLRLTAGQIDNLSLEFRRDLFQLGPPDPRLEYLQVRSLYRYDGKARSSSSLSYVAPMPHKNLAHVNLLLHRQIPVVLGNCPKQVYMISFDLSMRQDLTTVSLCAILSAGFANSGLFATLELRPWQRPVVPAIQK